MAIKGKTKTRILRNYVRRAKDISESELIFLFVILCQFPSFVLSFVASRIDYDLSLLPTTFPDQEATHIIHKNRGKIKKERLTYHKK